MKLNLNLLLLLLGLIACAWAYPNPNANPDIQIYEPENQLLEQEIAWSPYEQQLLAEQGELEEAPEQLHRIRRQLNVQGGGSPRQGFDLSVNGRAPVWQSPNGRHSLDATGQYSQHLGGPYGNSRPNWGAGAMYTFRF